MCCGGCRDSKLDKLRTPDNAEGKERRTQRRGPDRYSFRSKAGHKRRKRRRKATPVFGLQDQQAHSLGSQVMALRNFKVDRAGGKGGGQCAEW